MISNKKYVKLLTDLFNEREDSFDYAVRIGELNMKLRTVRAQRDHAKNELAVVRGQLMELKEKYEPEHLVPSEDTAKMPDTIMHEGRHYEVFYCGQCGEYHLKDVVG